MPNELSEQSHTKHSLLPSVDRRSCFNWWIL